jgi:two-component system, LuxR family, sensor kinase FixL
VICKLSCSCLRLITTGSGDLTDIATALAEIVNDANRASSIIARIRALSKKDLPEMVVLEVKDLVAEILPLVRYELNKRRIVLKSFYPTICPRSWGTAFSCNRSY